MISRDFLKKLYSFMNWVQVYTAVFDAIKNIRFNEDGVFKVDGFQITTVL